MKRRDRIRWFTGILAALLSFLVGCSSLPKRPVEEVGIGRQASAFHHAGLKHYHDGGYDKASRYFQRAVGLYGSVDNRPGVATTMASLGRARLAQGELGAAESCFQYANDVSRGIDRADLQAQALGGLGAVALAREQPDEALNWLEAALALPLANPSSERAVLLHDLGSAFWKLGEISAAEANLRRALAMHESLRDWRGLAGDCFMLAKLLAATGDHDQASRLALRALGNDKKAENPLGVAHDLTLLGELAADSQSLDEATGYFRRAELAWRAVGRTSEADQLASRRQAWQKSTP
ncbi:MAG: tetratricopeptide repeat protein [bacterium]